MNAADGFCFYDLETSGRDPRWHRILQFACIKTDAALEPLGPPTVLHGRLPEEVLPELEAMLVTRLTPQQVAGGLSEGELARRVFDATADARCCLTGYNSIRFDDEFLRFSYYRSLLEPYARERHGGARFDLLDLVRAQRALRPDGVIWPHDDDGLASARLVALSAANGIEHLTAHDAASDVLATLALAQLLRRAQPRLFEYAVSLSQRRNVERVLKSGGDVFVHVSGRIPRERSCLALMTMLGRHPRNARGFIVFDLAQDPRAFEALDEDELQRRLFAPSDALTDERLRMKEIRSNRTPFVAELSALRTQDAERLSLDVALAWARHRYLRARPAFVHRLLRAFSREQPANAPLDADAALYDNLISDADQALAARVRAQPSAPVPAADLDPRLATLIARYRARNVPEVLGAAEQQAWREFVRARLRGAVGAAVSVDAFAHALAAARTRGDALPLIDAWRDYARQLAQRFDLDWPENASD